ncbi:hypothetical protein UPYG_G00236950 [Umbra pygmaea]|uniref:Ferric-chelate reductase 1 n=1 Tax=Umbra pygmaea TaxID=75934 RepID=A0ABD0WJU4_UMBPY
MENSSKQMFAVAMVMAYMAMGTEAQSINIPSPLLVNISTVGCGSTKLCGFQSAGCTPGSSCLFFSAKQSMGQIFNFELVGPSSGFIALGLSTTQGGNATAYVCANSSNNLVLLSVLYNPQTNSTPLSSQNISGNATVYGKTMQCSFTASVPNATTFRSPSTSFFIAGYFGSFVDGNPVTIVQVISSQVLDLLIPANVTGLFVATTAGPTITSANATSANATPTSHAFGLQHTLSQALLILLGVVGLTML